MLPEPTPTPQDRSYKRLRTARKPYWCAWDFAHDRRITPGDKYYVYTDYPGSDIGYATTAGHPVRMRICYQCGSANS